MNNKINIQESIEHAIVETTKTWLESIEQL